MNNTLNNTSDAGDTTLYHMKKSTLVLLVISLVLLLSLTACDQRGYSQTPEFHIGKEGLNFRFVNQAPPQEVFEGTEFDVQLFIHNKGAFSLRSPDDDETQYRAKVNLEGYDSSKVFSITEAFLGQGLYVNPEHIRLEGKSYYYPDGEQDYFPLERFFAKAVPANFETSKVSFQATICYPYKTFFSEQVCIDTDPEGLGRRQQTCRVSDLSFSGGQGAPIAVTKIESKMIPRGQYVLPQFTIHLAHLGKGEFTDFILEADDNGVQGCSSEVTYTDKNIVAFNAWLGSDKLTCVTEKVRFDEKGKTSVDCFLDSQSIFAVGDNYYTQLGVELNYLYSQTTSTEVTIKRSAGYQDLDHGFASDSWDCAPWQAYDSSTRTCVDYCMYCQSNPHDENCQIDVSKAEEQGSATEFKTAFTCVYDSIQSCQQAKDNCILQSGLCMTGTYCGLPACLTKPGSNYQPQLIYDSVTSRDQIRFYCKDQDDIIDQARTCGCSETAYFCFLDPQERRSCESIPLIDYYTLPNGFYEQAYGRMDFNLHLDKALADIKRLNSDNICYPQLSDGTITTDMDICLAVKDNTGATAYTRIYYD
jgi:hypothetical protein